LPKPLPLAQAITTRIGAGGDDARQIVVDFAGENLKGVAAADIKAAVSSDKGTLRNIVVHPNPEIAGTRVSFQLAPGGEKAIELRAQLLRGDDPLSEVWVYRWTP
jgi:glucans biosynthesis protein